MRDGHRQKVYADTLTSHVSEAVNQLISRVRKFLQIWEPKELELQSKIFESDLEDRKRKVIRQPKQTTSVVRGPLLNRIL